MLHLLFQLLVSCCPKHACPGQLRCSPPKENTGMEMHVHIQYISSYVFSFDHKAHRKFNACNQF
ncbi:hypothetical protein ACP4OV_009211 [Aristida adscensionis]